ncbi:uncharacterized protein LOC113226711 [Hyposmocoma kahamanoa]|uniref:uncharacterized protein LOC113226711 n=1 Tax=Hyposmocoma kahamanoa TaxID=1477025 RepID=UPI000E6D88A1|nr:uncharacterized protein LOC113226711 [Hyposmocoma kahamanoa]
MGYPLALIIIRLLSLVALTIMLLVQVNYVRVFRFEVTMSEGLIVTYVISHVGLAFAVTSIKCEAFIFQVYLVVLGFILFGINATVLWWKWFKVDQKMQAVIELLLALELDVRFQILVKITLNIILVVLMIVDFLLTPLLLKHDKKEHYRSINDFLNTSNTVLRVSEFSRLNDSSGHFSDFTMIVDNVS